MDDKVLFSLAGAVVGGFVTISGQFVKHWLEERTRSKADKPRKELLLKMLNAGYEWRTLDKLMHVIGSDEATTKRLLLEVGARASENGEPVWALVERKPLASKS